MFEPARLQLLTRQAELSGFQIHQIDSHQAYLSYRPRRADREIWEITAQPQSPDGNRHFILKNLPQDRYLLIDSREAFLWELFDGAHGVDEITTAFRQRFGPSTEAPIRQFLAKLAHAGLLIGREHLALQQSLARSEENLLIIGINSAARYWRRLSFTVPDADRLCGKIYRYGGFMLFHPVTLALTIVLAVLAGVAAMQMSAHAKQFTQLISAKPWLSTTTLLAALLLVSTMHVTVHALACKAYGRRVRELGFFLLQGVVPTFYADVTDIFMSTRRARVIVDLAGPLVELFWGSVAFLAAYQTGGGIAQAFLFGVGILLWEGALINLYPFNFLEMDGYNIIADLLAMPTLRQQALALAPQLHRRMRHPSTLTKAEWLQIGYLLLCTVSVIAYLIAHLDFLRGLLPSWK